ncbi:MAG: hypothetical protein KIS76_10390 [Pyrinomonadaceae bacterium]|nr:hypothetical protein [Pyrinomonadaceae bacterium]
MTTTDQNAGEMYGNQLKMQSARSTEEKLLKNAVIKLNGHILGFVIGILCAIALFVATNWLVLKGGEEVGPHLGLLSNFFIWYDVTFLGSLIGAAYAFVCGYVGGLIIGSIYNAVVWLKGSR